ncbi:MAG TPA: JAB domain-containing protein [Fibrobacteraceae bacterium]|nr:JAB domain-containing protein [Fibrobacteraceae bacterium]
MSRNIRYSDDFYKSIHMLTGLPIRRIQEYGRENNPFNILEHPMVLEPNEKQLQKINKLNEFISSYNLLRIEEEQNKIKFSGPQESGRYFTSLLGGVKDKERFIIAFLDNNNGIIETRTHSEGGLGSTVVYPREILKMAMANDCAKMILCHNHPSGNLVSSKEDKALTQRLVDIFRPLDIIIVDHIIVGGPHFISMAEEACLPVDTLDKANYDAIELVDQVVKEDLTHENILSYGSM